MFGAFASIITFFSFIIALIVAITVHEFSHAYMADRLGDPTPRLQGRLTLNPLAHLDPIGTLLLFLVRFGWGKPVQFDPFNLENPRRDSALISIAGPISNIVTATICSVLLRILIATGLLLGNAIFLGEILQNIIYLNVLLAVFNLVPIHPLDGFKVVWGLLSKEQAAEWAQLERYGMIFLLVLIFPLFGPRPLVFSLINPIIQPLLAILLPGAAFI